MQTTARRNDWPLDKTVLVTEVTKKLPEQLDGQSKDGAYVHGLTLEGARWDEKSGMLDESRPKELFCPMPVSLQSSNHAVSWAISQLSALGKCLEKVKYAQALTQADD